MNDSNKHWVYRPANRRKLWIAGIIVLAASVIAEFFITLHPHFAISELFGFHAIIGFASCMIMVLAVKGLGYLIKRRDDYYDE